MLGILIVIRNIFIAAILAWVGIQFTPADVDADRSTPDQEQEYAGETAGALSVLNCTG